MPRNANDTMFGLLNVNKPTGVTSRDVVNQVQRLVKPAKIGHAGTLDPLASGVLVVCIGPATRLVESVQQMPKQYLGTFLLGRRSPTEDVDGPVEELVDPPIPTRQDIEPVAARFQGEILQTPPAFSALKVKGERAYDLARRGNQVELAPRPIQVHELRVVDYQYPKLMLDIRCGSGTYVRSLGRDIARELGTEAVMSALIRTAIGPFHVDQALDPAVVTKENLPAYLLPPQLALPELPVVQLNAQEIEHLQQGRPISNRTPAIDSAAAGITPSGQLAAILEPRHGKLWPSLCFVKAHSVGD